MIEHISSAAPLLGLQQLLAHINDAPVPHPVTDYVIDDARQCSALMGRALHPAEDEQVLICDADAESSQCLYMGVYIDKRVIAQLRLHDPLQQLSDVNLAEFCTAVEGISHFNYLSWCVAHARQASMLELELQAEVDKYAAATCLLMRQAQSFQRGLHQRLFAQVSFLPALERGVRERYDEANRGAARFCRRNDERYLNCRLPKPERWFGALRELFRCGHHEKLRRALS